MDTHAKDLTVTTDKLDMKVDFGEWIVVCDGRKALILENTGDKRRPNLKTKEVFEHADLSTRALGADAPGRTHNLLDDGRAPLSKRIGTTKPNAPFWFRWPTDLIPLSQQVKRPG